MFKETIRNVKSLYWAISTCHEEFKHRFLWFRLKKEKSQFTDQTLATSYNLMLAFFPFWGKGKQKALYTQVRGGKMSSFLFFSPCNHSRLSLCSPDLQQILLKSIWHSYAMQIKRNKKTLKIISEVDIIKLVLPEESRALFLRALFLRDLLCSGS